MIVKLVVATGKVTEMAVLLREAAAERELEGIREETEPQGKGMLPLWIPVLGTCVVLLLGSFFYVSHFRSVESARLTGTKEVTWLSHSFEEGDRLSAGEKIHLASGRAEIRFRSGATSEIVGPALFEIESGNGGFLHFGKAFSTAEGESSKGFTIRTPSSTYVDQGTEFITEATTDGYSQMLVLEGEVDAEAVGFDRRRVVKGNGIGFDPGKTPIMIQIEQGSETTDFDFPSIPPPSSTDFASRHPVSMELESRGLVEEKSVLAPASAGPGVLVNGRAQRNQDDPNESFFFRNDTTGYLLFDFLEAVSVTAIHTYSWHRNRKKPESTLRAVQRFTVWGAKTQRPPGLPDSENASGWERVARVDTDAFFQVRKQADRPPQQACRLVPASGAIGTYRYLLFEVLPTGDEGGMPPRHTFFSEIDIFSEK